jgi:epsilon-lactone hydrolase
MSEYVILVFLLVLLLLWLAVMRLLTGEDLSRFDSPAGRHFETPAGPTPERQAVLHKLAGFRQGLGGMGWRQRLQLLRERFDQLFSDKTFSANFVAVDAGGVPAEWVMAPGADADRRLLYLHGGAWMLGSRKSHRSITSRLSAIGNCAVLAIDYRLLPEHPRSAGIEDCQIAYRWMLENGPAGLSRARRVLIGGDSAGGNLTLVLLAWIRDRGLRQADAALAFSPATDMSMSSPTLRSNLATDLMLGPVFGKLTRVPAILLLLSVCWVNRMRPNRPEVSPVFGDLSGLPPLLIQASSAEMLLGDARRYANKAIAAGSPVRLQTWSQMLHVWQLFNPELPEAEQALFEVGQFLAEVAAD